MSPGLAPLEGKYEILAKIKEGGMGAIYKVRHRLLDEVRVVKTLRRELETDAGLRQRFIQEARSAIRLRHPNVVQIFDFLIESDVGYIVMEYIDGVDFAELIRRGARLSLPLFLELAGQGLKALGYLHQKGFVHRDISPDNLMLSSDFAGRPLVKMIDLGIAKNVERSPALTASGMFLGKFRYSSPEHFGSQGTGGIEPRSDLYSYGVVLYELATGSYPIQGEGDSSHLIAGHLFHPPKTFEETDPEERIPRALRANLLRCLDKDPAERFASAGDFAAALAELRSQFPVTGTTLEEARALNTLRAAEEPVTSDSAQEDLDQVFNGPTPSRGASATGALGTEEVRREHIAALMGGAEALLRVDQTEAARGQLLAVLRLEADHPRARELLGEIDDDLAVAETVSWNQGTPPPATAPTEVSPTAEPSRHEGLFDHHLQAACALAEDGSFADAIPHFEAALAVQPDNEAVRRMLDETHHKLGAEQEASRNRLGDEVRQLEELLASGEHAQAKERLLSARRAYGDVEELAELRREIERAESREQARSIRETLSEVVRLREEGCFTEAVREIESARKAWRSAGFEERDEGSDLAADLDREEALLEEAHRKAAALDETIYAVESSIADGKLVDADRALFQAFEAFGKVDRLRELRKKLDEHHHQELVHVVHALLDEAGNLASDGEVAGARSSLEKARVMAPEGSALVGEIEERRRAVEKAAAEWGKRRRERLAAEIERLVESQNLEQAQARMNRVEPDLESLEDEEKTVFEELRERIADGFQERVNALIHEAGVAIEARRYGAAIPFLEQALELSPDDKWLADRLDQARAAAMAAEADRHGPEDPC